MQFDLVKANMAFSTEMNQLTSELGYEVSIDDTKRWLEALLSSASYAVFVAVSGPKVCAWVVAEKRLCLESGFSAEITGLVVGARFRRKGIAQALVNAAQHWAQEQNLERLVVRSNALRKESHIFYPSIGFSHSKTSQVYVKSLACVE